MTNAAEELESVNVEIAWLKQLLQARSGIPFLYYVYWLSVISYHLTLSLAPTNSMLTFNPLPVDSTPFMAMTSVSPLSTSAEDSSIPDYHMFHIAPHISL